MKTILMSFVIGIMTTLLFSACASTNYMSQSPEVIPPEITYQSFYDNLSPYGTWINYPGYGNVWNPRMQAGFRPYATNGRWAYSHQGWAWQSNYSWGWAPFHYGSWIYDDMYGWLWKPGYEWSPAWVTWGSSGNNYAWAPLMPDVNIGVQFGNYMPHQYYWNVCGRDHIYDRNISNVIVHNTNVTNNITIINNYNKNTTNNYYAKGPDVNEVQRYTRNKIEPVTFRDVNQSNQTRQTGNVMQVYRPSVQNSAKLGMKENNTTSTLNTGVNGTDRQRNNVNRNQQVPVQNQQPISPQKTDNNTVRLSRERGFPQQENNTNDGRNKGEKQSNAAVNRSQQTAENNGNRNPSANPPQSVNPRQYRRAEAEQIRPVRNNSAAPINQPRQQRQNVQQLPMQRIERGNGNRERGNSRDNRRNN